RRGMGCPVPGSSPVVEVRAGGWNPDERGIIRPKLLDLSENRLKGQSLSSASSLEVAEGEWRLWESRLPPELFPLTDRGTPARPIHTQPTTCRGLSAARRYRMIQGWESCCGAGVAPAVSSWGKRPSCPPECDGWGMPPSCWRATAGPC